MDGAALFRQFLGKGDSFLVTGHENPDGDCLGSQVGIYHLLRGLGRDVALVASDPLPRKFSFLVSWLRRVEGGVDALRAAVRGAQAAFACDCASVDRLGVVGRVVDEARLPILFLDHHAIDSGKAPEWLHVRVEAAATGEIVFDLVRSLGVPLTREIAEGLFVALVTDTGWFRYSNTRARVFEIARELLATGVEASKVYSHLYQSNPSEWLRLVGSVLSGLEVEAGGKVALGTITKRMLAETGARLQETEEILDLLRSLDGVEVALVFKETDGDGVRVSLRSRASVDVAKVAQRFGGGGHSRAAGATVPGGLVGARAAVLREISAQLDGAAGAP
jgi:phosphoesterase RecJ-like protein